MEIAKATLLAGCLCLSLGCSPRDFLTRRLAADLISQSAEFKQPQTFLLATGLVSNKELNSPESLVLQQRGWIIGTQDKKCPPGMEPPPCWDVQLSPLGVEVIRPLIPNGAENEPLAIPVARRKLVAIAGIGKAGNFADVDFIWQWLPLNQVGAALYDTGIRYRSTVAFRDYDDGWRIMSGNAHTNQTMDEALRNAQATAP
jgi:hypothetical protein